MKPIAVDHSSEREDAFPGARVMGVVNDNLKRMFLGGMSWACAESANPGYPARSRRKLVGMGTPCTTLACRGCCGPRTCTRCPADIFIAFDENDSVGWRRWWNGTHNGGN